MLPAPDVGALVPLAVPALDKPPVPLPVVPLPPAPQGMPELPPAPMVGHLGERPVPPAEPERGYVGKDLSRHRGHTGSRSWGATLPR